MNGPTAAPRDARSASSRFSRPFPRPASAAAPPRSTTARRSSGSSRSWTTPRRTPTPPSTSGSSRRISPASGPTGHEATRKRRPPISPRGTTRISEHARRPERDGPIQLPRRLDPERRKVAGRRLQEPPAVGKGGAV